MTEFELQKSIIAETEWRANQDIRWALLFAIPNGQYREGQRLEPGLKAGVPDLFLPVPSGDYHGLFIELKVGKNGPSAIQSAWHIYLREQGYACYVIWDDADMAIRIIENYLGAV